MFFQEFKGPPVEAYNITLNKLRERAKKELNLSDSEIITRSLRPEDIGFANPVYTSTIAASSTAQWSNLINTYTIADNRFIGICGLSYDAGEHNVVALKITRSGKTAREWSIQQIDTFEDKTGYADDPFTVGQNEQLTIQKYAITTSSSETSAFIGIVVEKRGILVSP